MATAGVNEVRNGAAGISCFPSASSLNFTKAWPGAVPVPPLPLVDSGPPAPDLGGLGVQRTEAYQAVACGLQLAEHGQVVVLPTCGPAMGTRPAMGIVY